MASSQPATPRARIRRSIADRECYCTNEIFMWPSIVFQPLHLAKSMLGARVWERALPLPASERAAYDGKIPAVIPIAKAE